MVDEKPMAWLPFSIAEAALSGGGVRRGSAHSVDAFAGTAQRCRELVASAPVNRNRIDYASGMRHLMVLLAVGLDEALRADLDPVLSRGAHEHRRHLDLGHGVSRCHLPAGHAARWRDVSVVRQPRAPHGTSACRRWTGSCPPRIVWSTISMSMRTATSRRYFPPTNTRATG